MMNILETFLAWIEELWPFRMVETGERGVYYVAGHALRQTVGPGVYPVIPWFMDIDTVSVLPRVLSTPLLDLTLADGRALSFTLTSVVQVVDARKALVEIDDYQESVGELIASMAADKVADVSADRLEPDRRRRLLADLRRWVTNETEQYGVQVLSVRFTNFVTNIRPHRLLLDSSQLSTGM